LEEQRVFIRSESGVMALAIPTISQGEFMQIRVQ